MVRLMPARLPADEPSLVHLAAQCSDEAFCALTERFGRHLRLTVSRFAQNPEDRDDLQAEVVAKLLDNGKQALRVWRPIAPFIAYLTTIGVRHCLHWVERRRRLEGLQTLQLPFHGLADDADWPERLVAADPADQPPAALERSLVQEALHDALQELSADDRLVLALRFEQGLNGPTVARLLGISPGAARQRIFKALRRLERRLLARNPDLFGPS